MNFLKKVFGFIVNFTIGPVLRLKNIRTMSLGDHVVNTISIVARGLVVASYFTAIPAILVKLSLLWIFGGFIIAGIFALFAGVLGLGALFAFFGYAASQVAKDAADDAVVGEASPAV